jgi:hypothetical protein
MLYPRHEDVSVRTYTDTHTDNINSPISVCQQATIMCKGSSSPCKKRLKKLKEKLKKCKCKHQKKHRHHERKCNPCDNKCDTTVVTQVSPRGALVIADESGPTSFNPDGIGWNFTNVNSTSARKINWYSYLNIPTNAAATYSSLKANWARVTIHNCAPGAQFPFFVTYSARLNDGQDAGSFYRSRAVYEIAPAEVVCDQEVILYTGADPVCFFPNLPHIQLNLTSFVGPTGQTNFLPGEIISRLSLQTNSGAPTGAVDITVYTLGYQIADVCEQLALQTVLL